MGVLLQSHSLAYRRQCAQLRPAMATNPTMGEAFQVYTALDFSLPNLVPVVSVPPCSGEWVSSFVIVLRSLLFWRRRLEGECREEAVLCCCMRLNRSSSPWMWYGCCGKWYLASLWSISLQDLWIVFHRKTFQSLLFAFLMDNSCGGGFPCDRQFGSSVCGFVRDFL